MTDMRTAIPTSAKTSADPLHAPFETRTFYLHFERLQRAPVRVGDCLAYPSMFDPPDAFEAWSVADFRRRRLDDATLLWVDACPAYALALSTHDTWHESREVSADCGLDAHWQGLRGYSSLGWPEALRIVSAAWRALDDLEAVVATRRVARAPDMNQHSPGARG